MSARRAPRSRSRGESVVSLGVEPPLSVAGAAAPETLDRRAVSLRWLAGTVLTGMAGAALLGGAIYSTLQGKAEIVQALRLATAQARHDDRVSNGARKGDRLSAEQETAAARQVMRVSSSTRQGDREIVRMRPFVRVSAPLARAPTEFASRVPPFDPMKTLAAAGRDRAAPNPVGEGDLSFTVSDLSVRTIAPDEGPTVQPVDVRARVREAAAFEFATRFEPTSSVSPAAEGALAYAAAQGGVPMPGVLDVRPAARNMTLVAKSAAGADKAAAAPGESAIAVTAGGPLAAALERDADVAPQDARVIADRFAGRDGYGIASVMAGQRLKVLMGRTAAPGGARLTPVRVSLFDADGSHVGSVAMSDIGDYVAVADPGDLADEPTAEEIADEVERPGTPGRMRLYNGLYEAALKNQVPGPIVDEMVRIVSYDVDFNRPVALGDSFEVFFGDSHEPGGDGEVAYMALKLGGEQRRFYRFETDDDAVDFYDDAGKSAKKFLMRKPMNGGVMRSGFGFRRHPVLGYSKMHTGVDWAAPSGTPIVASGNGTVEKSGWASGYGRQVTLRHANGYETTYNHMSGIARGVSPGAKVRQGQVVGYVGSTGLSTGPHLHYEVMVNGRFVNPMTIKLPRGRELDVRELGKFAAERTRIDGLLGRGPAAAAKASVVGGGG